MAGIITIADDVKGGKEFIPMRESVNRSAKYLPALGVWISLLAGMAQARTLLRESFETASLVRWQHVWGTAAVTDERAHSGSKSLRCTIENRYGMSVHYCDFPARAGATYTLTAYLFIPQDRECHPVLQLCQTNWEVLSQAVPNKKNEWVELRCEWTNKDGLSYVRVALHNAPWKEGLGGATYYWDDIVLREEGGIMEKAGARGKNPYVIAGLEVTPAGGMKVAVAAGKARLMGEEVSVQPAILDVAPQVVLSIKNEALQLTDEKPQGWGKGTALRHCLGFGASLPGCLEPGSIRVKEKPDDGGIAYEKGKDWIADEMWGRLGRLADGRIKAGQTVYVDYRIRLLRVDTICISPEGKPYIRQGDSQRFCPSIPGADYGSLALCNIYLPYGCKEITPKEIYPIGEPFPSPDVDFLESHRARVAKTRAKLESGQEVTIVAWGDSVTAGGDATRPEFRFPDAFAQALRYKFPQARVNLINAGRGGWNTDMSLPLFSDDVIKHKPDLVTMEFVNDMGMTEEHLRKNWFQAIDQVRAAGGEVVIITPHFTMPQRMGHDGLETPETRPAVAFLRQIAEEKQVALADASKRWEHLAAEGIPYFIHLRNGINHPDDFGHQLFVDELMRLF